MLATLKGLVTTLAWAFRKPVTAQYPKQHLPIQPRYMGFPALLWDDTAGEPFCTGCMVCVRECPTQCMKAEMKDNPLQQEGKSHRRKIIERFEINWNRCILCGICVEVCNFDAIEMSHVHELGGYARAGSRVTLQELLKYGREFQERSGWKPSNPEKNVAGVALAKEKEKRQPAAAASRSEPASSNPSPGKES